MKHEELHGETATVTAMGIRFERVADGAHREPRYIVPLAFFNKREELDFFPREEAVRLAKWRAGRYRFTPYRNGRGDMVVGTVINLAGLAQMIREETGR